MRPCCFPSVSTTYIVMRKGPAKGAKWMRKPGRDEIAAQQLTFGGFGLECSALAGGRDGLGFNQGRGHRVAGALPEGR
jgi:hypothetical protein